LKLRLFASLYFGSGRRVSIWLFVVNLNFIFSMGQRLQAGRYKISHLQQYLLVGGNFQNLSLENTFISNTRYFFNFNIHPGTLRYRMCSIPDK
jgi:hypothetical protein